MKILFYEKPSSSVLINEIAESIKVVYNHFQNFLANNLSSNKDVEIKTIVSEITYYQNQQYKFIDNLNLIPILDNEIKKPFGPYASLIGIFKKQYLDKNLSDSEAGYLKNLFKEKLGDWVPDLIISIDFKNELLSDLYPNALSFSNENGLFSRPPFMRTLFFDPCGFMEESFLNKYKDDIKKIKISSEEDKKIQELKNKIVELIEESNPFSKDLELLKKQFRKLVLLPLCNVYETANGSDFSNDYDYVEFVMDNLPKDVAVIITQHDIAPSFNKNLLNYFRSKYKNFIFFDNSHKFSVSPSLYFLKHVDAVINSLSGTGIQSLIWDKKIISTGEKYNDWFKDAQGLENIEKVFNSPVVDKNNILYWYLTHYVVFEKRLYQKDWLYNYFKNKIQKFRNEGMNFDYYDQNEDITELSEYIINHVEKSISESKKSFEVPKTKENWIGYFYDVNQKTKLKNLSKKLKNKKVVIYGAGLITDTIFETYNMSEFDIVAVCDQRFKEKTTYHNIDAIPIASIKEYNPDIILISVYNTEAVLNTLIEKKIDIKTEHILKLKR